MASFAGHGEGIHQGAEQLGGQAMDTIWFWVTATAMCLAVIAVLVRALYRAEVEAAPNAAADLQVYRDQMAEADRDLARGTLTEAEAQRVKTEIARRILEADRALKAEGATPAATGRRAPIPALLTAATVLAGLAVYNDMGVPWYPDLPIAQRIAEADARMATRPPQAEAVAATPAPPAPEVDADFTVLMEKLRAAIDPATATDLRGLDLLARNEAALGNLAAAEAAQRRIIAVKGEAATAEDFAALAELMIRAAGGYVSPEAEAELIRALERDPRNGIARYFSGLMFVQGGRFDLAFDLWEPLLRESPPEAPWVAPIRGQIEEVAQRAGVQFTLPEAAGGPTGADVAAAAEMTPEERQAMIEGMVAQLGDRLATEGGSAEEWARLITALATLGRMDEARTIYAEAQRVFEGRTVELQGLREAAVTSGVAE
jgi:cytochrome c-type biogenesis protein CcmH